VEAAHILEPLYGTLFVPQSVYQQLRAPGTPHSLKLWAKSPPPWFIVRPNPPNDSSLAHLDPGERAAIGLAELLQASELLMDELPGQAAAKARHLDTSGTLGVLADAHMAGLLDFESILIDLRKTNFRVAAIVELRIRERLAGHR
jgi:predicted nucleic acid-binding protein